MQTLMLRLHALADVHRRVILAIWVLLVGIAIPFATHQSEHLTSGGYAVAGSQSAQVEATLR